MALGLSNFRVGLPFTEMGRCTSVHLSLLEDIRTYIWAMSNLRGLYNITMEMVRKLLDMNANFRIEV